MLENTFIAVLNMSITASVVAALIIFFRWILGNTLPKVFNYVLWAVVLVRLLVPFSLPSMFSIFNAIAVPETIMTQSPQYNGTDNNYPYRADYESVTQEKTVSDVLKYNMSSSFPAATPEASVDPMQIFIFIIAWIWLSGVAGLFTFSIFAYFRASRRLKEAVLYKHNELISQCSQKLKLNREVEIYTSDRIHTPVVCGLLKARIILPLDLTQDCNELELNHIITHELVHIKRLDYIIKPLAVLTLCIHWFNPIMWLSFVLSQKDMEMSCDARVLSVNNRDIRSEYAKSLLNIAARQNGVLHGGLLAFGENNIKSRIKGIMSFKKTRVWMGVTAVTVLIVFGFVLLTNGQNDGTGRAAKGDNHSPLILVNENDLNNMLKHRSRYIGDASNVSNLLSKLPYGDRKNGISLDTDSRPYGITVNYNLEDADKIQNIKPVLLDNALILFSLVENVETVHFNILSANRYEFQFTRAEMQEYFDKDLWAYSKDKRAFEEFLMDISFDILVYPEKYTPLMSSVPGMRIDISLNAAYYNFPFNKKCSAKNGFLHTWNSGKVSEPSKTISLPNGPVYWSPLDMAGTDKEDAVTISILDKEGNIMIEKQISIIKDGRYYSVKPSHDVLTDNYYDLERN
jgi:beta-lactamase regulating signal transducer with metallopeptidase domain